MNFENVNPLNIKLNKLSGNLLPMTDDNTVFSTRWKIYGAIMLLLNVTLFSGMILGAILAPKIKILLDSTVAFVVHMEVFFALIRMYMCKGLLRQLIRKLNKVLHVEDKIMTSVVRSTMWIFETPFKFYWMFGSIAILLWYCTSFLQIYKKKQFFYEDYKISVVYSKQPFSINIFLLGSFIGCIGSMNAFVKKNAVDIYIINILLLTTAQYRYIANKLATITQQEILQKEHSKHRGKYQSNVDLRTEMEIKALCRHHNAIIQMTPILKKLLSVNFSLIYLINVFRFCFLGIMLIFLITLSITEYSMEILVILFYLCGALIQFYILCLCVHQLLEANVEMTDKVFHTKWYQFGPSVKNMFLLMIIGNNIECKLSVLEKINLSLPSFVTILNQSYTIALLFLKIK